MLSIVINIQNTTVFEPFILTFFFTLVKLKGKKSKLTTCIFFILSVFILVSWLLTVSDLMSPTLKRMIKLTTVSRLLSAIHSKNIKLTTVSRLLSAIHSKNIKLTTVSRLLNAIHSKKIKLTTLSNHLTPLTYGLCVHFRTQRKEWNT